MTVHGHCQAHLKLERPLLAQGEASSSKVVMPLKACRRTRCSSPRKASSYMRELAFLGRKRMVNLLVLRCMRLRTAGELHTHRWCAKDLVNITASLKLLSSLEPSKTPPDPDVYSKSHTINWSEHCKT